MTPFENRNFFLHLINEDQNKFYKKNSFLGNIPSNRECFDLPLEDDEEIYCSCENEK